jgi:hypothetical protein
MTRRTKAQAPPVDLEAKVARITARAPWAKPPPALRAPNTGDAKLDLAIAALDGPRAEGAARKLRASTHRRLVDALFDVLDDLERAGGKPPDFDFGKAQARVPEELRPYVAAVFIRNRDAWAQRKSTIPWVVSVLDARMNDSLADRFAKRFERAGSRVLREALAESLLGWRGTPYQRAPRPKAAASRRHLEVLARHLVPADERCEFAAEALLLLDPAGARARIGDFLASVPAKSRKQVMHAIGMRLVGRIDLDEDPAWVAVLGPMLRGFPEGRLTLLEPLREARSSAPVLAALTHTDDDATFGELLDRLRALAEPAAKGPLLALAHALPDRSGRGVARARRPVLELAKRLPGGRGAPVKASFTRVASVGTDGGPMVLLPASIAGDWRGAGRDHGARGAKKSDYDRACAVSERRPVALRLEGRDVVVLAQQAGTVVSLSDGALLVVLMGSDLQVETALRERRPFRKLPGKLQVKADGLVLLDAAFSVTRAPKGGVARIPAASGRYGVEEMRDDTASGDVWTVRLTRS